MNSTWKWILSLFGVFLFAMLIALPFFLGPRMGSMTLLGRGGILMHRNLGFLGVFRMAPLLLISLAVVGFAIYGIIAFFRKPRVETPNQITCHYCGKPLQDEWLNCPFCGKKIKK